MIQALDPQLVNAPVFTAFRNDELLGNFRGNKGHDSEGDYIDFKFPNKIAVGDIIIDDNATEYIVNNIAQPKCIGGLPVGQRFHKVYYTLKEKKETATITHIVNVNNPNNSPIHIQQGGNSPVLLANFQNAINLCDEADKQLLQELYAIVVEIYNGKKFVKKGGLAKFGDAVAKYAPIATALGQLLCQILMH